MSRVMASHIPHIQAAIVFRASYRLSRRSTHPVGVHVKNLKNQDTFEFTETSAVLCLLIDGSSNIGEIIRNCKKRMKISDPRFEKLSFKFFEELIENNLIAVGPRKKPDDRVEYRNEVLKIFFRSQAEKPRPAGQTKSQKKRVIRLEKGDRAGVEAAQKNFLKFIKNVARFNIKRVFPSLYGNRFHVFSSQLIGKHIKSNESGYGAGTSVERAAISATGEAIERFYSFGTEPDILAKSFNELIKSKRNVLNPKSWHFFGREQTPVARHELGDFKPDSVLNWTWFDDAHHPKKKILIPSEVNGAHFSQNQKSLFGEISSNGCAAGTDPDSAKLRAGLELVERDGFIFYWRTQNSPALIDLSNPNERIGRLLALLGPFKSRVHLFHLRSDLDVATVQAVILGNTSKGQPRFVSCAAARLDGTDAIEKAILETLYVFKGQLNEGPGKKIIYGEDFNNTVWDFMDHTNLYSWFPAKRGYQFLFPKIKKYIHWSHLPQKNSGNATEDLLRLISEFRRHRLRLYFKNNSPQHLSDSGVWVYRAFSPDLLSLEATHRFQQLGNRRYYRLPQTLGLKRKPLHSAQLNPWPHPLP